MAAELEEKEAIALQQRLTAAISEADFMAPSLPVRTQTLHSLLLHSELLYFCVFQDVADGQEDGEEKVDTAILDYLVWCFSFSLNRRSVWCKISQRCRVMTSWQ